MHRIPLSAYFDTDSIDLDDRTYILSPPGQMEPDKGLIASIRQFGILHPPVVRQIGNKLITVAGRKRILAARQIGLDKILCLRVAADTEEEYIYHLIAEESLCGGTLSLVEQAGLLAGFLRHRPAGETQPLLEKLGFKPQQYILDELLSLLSLERSALTAVHLGKIPYKPALKLQRLSAENQKILAHLITSLNLGGSKQNKLIDYCTELIMRTNVPLGKLLENFTAGEAADSPENIPQKTGALFNWLHKQCFPRITEAETEFRKSVAALDLPEYVHLEHAASFEEDTVTVSVRLSGMEQVRQMLPGILERVKNPET